MLCKRLDKSACSALDLTWEFYVSIGFFTTEIVAYSSDTRLMYVLKTATEAEVSDYVSTLFSSILSMSSFDLSYDIKTAKIAWARSIITQYSFKAPINLYPGRNIRKRKWKLVGKRLLRFLSDTTHSNQLWWRHDFVKYIHVKQKRVNRMIDMFELKDNITAFGEGGGCAVGQKK